MGKLHSTAECLCKMDSGGIRYYFKFFVCCSKLRWLIVFKSVDICCVHSISPSSCLINVIAIRTNRVGFSFAPVFWVPCSCLLIMMESMSGSKIVAFYCCWNKKSHQWNKSLPFRGGRRRWHLYHFSKCMQIKVHSSDFLFPCLANKPNLLIKSFFSGMRQNKTMFTLKSYSF